jgi:uncharacterized membrane protein YphA (DoxX/SURF4 family)
MPDATGNSLFMSHPLPSPSKPAPRVAPNPWISGFILLARWSLGALFIYMGMNKALHPVEFLKLIRQYDMVHHHVLLNLIGTALPWFEVFCGVLLVAGLAVRGTAVMLIVMLIPFTAIVLKRALAIQAGGGIPFCAIKFDCGCGTGEVFICHKLAENTLLTLLALALAICRRGILAIRYSFA